MSHVCWVLVESVAIYNGQTAATSFGQIFLFTSRIYFVVVSQHVQADVFTLDLRSLIHQYPDTPSRNRQYTQLQLHVKSHVSDKTNIILSK